MERQSKLSGVMLLTLVLTGCISQQQGQQPAKTTESEPAQPVQNPVAPPAHPAQTLPQPPKCNPLTGMPALRHWWRKC